MGQEFFINSQELEDKVRALLPSQGGAGSGFDLSASTQIIPIIDLTESAEGSNLRQDLQTSLSFDTVTAFNVTNGNSTLINTTGYYRVFGAYYALQSSGSDQINKFVLNDGSSDKIILAYERILSGGAGSVNQSFDFIVRIDAGDSLIVTSTDNNSSFIGCTKQIASIDGVLN